MLKKKFPSLSSLGSDGNTAFLRAARAGHLDKVLEQLKTNIDINTSNNNGLNALHLASKEGHVHVVSELLRRGASVDAATKKGNTALHIASLAGQEEVVKLLVEHAASVNVQSQNGFTPLYMAAQENHDNVVRYLLANGANQSLSTEDGFTPLAVAMQQGHDKVVAVLLESDTRGKVRLPALHIAAKKDDCKAAALLLQNEHNPDVTSKSGFTPLHIAAHYGNENIANLLLAKGADVNYSAKHNITPLHVAAKWGKSNMVALLLEKGGNIESKTRDGLTPLHCAARSGHEQVVDMLLERGAPISSKTKNGLAPLHMASQGDHVDAARILLYHRAPVDEVTMDYLTALHVAAHCGHVRVAKLLLDRKADPDARALNGFTPLHIACKKNRIKVVELLLKHGASIEATTESGLTPLHVASFMGCMNIVIFLLQHNANPDVPTVRGETPLHLAARANQTDIIRILLRNGAQVDARAREQQTPLHIASRLGNVDIVMLLLQHGAQIDATTKDMYTALHIAAKEGQEEVATVLLEHGATLTATTKKGFTPLHLASKYGNIKVAQLLLQRDAPVDAQGKNGVTPLHVASHYDHQNVALLLLDKGASPHATAKNGHTPLHIAARKNQMDIASTLLEFGAKANSESKAGFTPLHLSSQEGHTDMSNLLIEHQADVNHKAKNGLSPLHLCAQEDRTNVANILVKNAAEVDATTKAGYTPLHVACHFGQVNMVRFLLGQGANVNKNTSIGYTPLHQASQQGHATIVQLLLDNGGNPNLQTSQGQTPLSISQKLGYISVVEALKGVTKVGEAAQLDEKYRVVAPETMQEIFMSDSEDENGEDTTLTDQPYRYLTVDEMKSLGDDSLPIDVTRDERMDSNREGHIMSADDTISPQHIKESYTQFSNITADNVDLGKHPINVGFLVSFLVDARGGAMRGCRHSGVRVIVPPRKAPMPMRVTCRYLKKDKLIHPPPLMEGEALASRVLELGPVGAKFLGPVIIEVPHFASLRNSEREIVILRSDNGETWREHTLEASDDAVHDVLNESFDGDELSQIEEQSSTRITRILTNDFPQYFAIVSRIRQEVHPIGPEGGMVSSSVVPQVQAVFPQGALTKKIKVGLQAQPISAELTAKLLGNRVAVSPIVTVEPRRRKFHKPITLTIPVPRAANKGMINQYSGDAPTLRLLCSITGGTSRAQWEDVTGSTPLTFVNDCVSFTTTVSARFWLMDCRNIGEATKMATELYREAIHVPFMAKFVVFAKRVDVLEARLRVFCMTDDREDKTLEHQEHFTEVAKSRDVEVLEGKPQYVEFAGNIIPVTKSGDQLQLGFRAFRENRLPFTVRVKDPHVDSVGRLLFMREAKVGKGEPPQQPICCLNIVLPETIMPDALHSEPDLVALQHKINYLRDSGIEAQRSDLRLADISNLLGNDWVVLAPHLNLYESDINLIKSECPANVSQQARAMLRLWLYQQGNKATGKSLEIALHRINRNDIAQHCIFNEQQMTLTGDLGISRVPHADDRDIMKDSESVEDLSKTDIRKAEERDEKKYLAEEKEVEEEKKTVKERKEEIERRLSQERQYSDAQRRSMSITEDKVLLPKSQQRYSVATEFIQSEIRLESEERNTSESAPEEKPISVKEKISIFKEIEKQNGQPVGEILLPDIKQISEVRAENIAKTTEQMTSKVQDVRGQEVTETQEILLIKEQENRRRDSELLEGVSQGLEKFGKTEHADLLSPKLSKTPPPSPADFLTRGESQEESTSWIQKKQTEKTSTSQEWVEKGQSEENVRETEGVPPDQERTSWSTNNEKRKFETKQPYVTSPSMKRRVQSQRISREERPGLFPVYVSRESYSSEEEVEYIVTEPVEGAQSSAQERMQSSPNIYTNDPRNTIEEVVNSVKKADEIISEDQRFVDTTENTAETIKLTDNSEVSTIVEDKSKSKKEKKEKTSSPIKAGITKIGRGIGKTFGIGQKHGDKIKEKADIIKIKTENANEKLLEKANVAKSKTQEEKSVLIEKVDALNTNTQSENEKLTETVDEVKTKEQSEILIKRVDELSGILTEKVDELKTKTQEESEKLIERIDEEKTKIPEQSKKLIEIVDEVKTKTQEQSEKLIERVDEVKTKTQEQSEKLIEKVDEVKIKLQEESDKHADTVREIKTSLIKQEEILFKNSKISVEKKENHIQENSSSLLKKTDIECGNLMRTTTESFQSVSEPTKEYTVKIASVAKEDQLEHNMKNQEREGIMKQEDIGETDVLKLESTLKSECKEIKETAENVKDNFQQVTTQVVKDLAKYQEQINAVVEKTASEGDEKVEDLIYDPNEGKQERVSKTEIEIQFDDLVNKSLPIQERAENIIDSIEKTLLEKNEKVRKKEHQQTSFVDIEVNKAMNAFEKKGTGEIRDNIKVDLNEVKNLSEHVKILEDLSQVEPVVEQVREQSQDSETSSLVRVEKSFNTDQVPASKKSVDIFEKVKGKNDKLQIADDGKSKLISKKDDINSILVKTADQTLKTADHILEVSSKKIDKIKTETEQIQEKIHQEALKNKNKVDSDSDGKCKEKVKLTTSVQDEAQKETNQREEIIKNGDKTQILDTNETIETTNDELIIQVVSNINVAVKEDENNILCLEDKPPKGESGILEKVTEPVSSLHFGAKKSKTLNQGSDQSNEKKAEKSEESSSRDINIELGSRIKTTEKEPSHIIENVAGTTYNPETIIFNSNHTKNKEKDQTHGRNDKTKTAVESIEAFADRTERIGKIMNELPEQSSSKIKGISIDLGKETVKKEIKTEEEVLEELFPKMKVGTVLEKESTPSYDFKEIKNGLNELVNKKDSKTNEEDKARPLFHIESEEDLQIDLEAKVPDDSESSVEEFIEKVKEDLKITLEKEQQKLVAEKPEELLEISQDTEKVTEVSVIKIGRFQIRPTTVEEREEVDKILEKLKVSKSEDKEEVEKELPEKLTKEEFEAIIRELKSEGLKADMYLQLEESTHDEDKKLKRVERRFERMASETMDQEKQNSNVSEEKLDEKREREFQRMVSQLSTEEVAECQNEYLQLWEEGGLSSLTPTDEWESKDPDTPENELDDDSPRKPGEEEITRDKTNQQVATSSAGANAGVEKSRRPPLVTDISMDDETEYDVTEHDCRQQLELLHAEADEEAIDEQLDSVLAASSSSFEPFKK